ncbi:MAG: hypothetical protein J7507_02410, partial [Pseudoxanthomonas sp.]|nr:hypothetical protein [Pseudoxanthomonas sp.]
MHLHDNYAQKVADDVWRRSQFSRGPSMRFRVAGRDAAEVVVAPLAPGITEPLDIHLAGEAAGEHGPCPWRPLCCAHELP